MATAAPQDNASQNEQSRPPDGRAESPEYASKDEQQAESTRRLIQVYSITAPVKPKKEKEKRPGQRTWILKTGNKRIDSLLHEPSTRRLKALRYRARALWLLALYVPLLVMPWMLTCILSRRPVMARSYVAQQGFSAADMASMRNWKRAVDVLSSIAGLVTIPLLSALLAQGAVVFSQRRRPGQFLSLPDLFALVDGGWTSVAALWSSLKTRGKKGPGREVKFARWYLLPGAALILLGAIQQPLVQVLVQTETVYVATCSDLGFLPRCNGRALYFPSSGPRSIGVDIEPAQMANTYHAEILPRITAELASVSVDQDQPSVWSDYSPGRLQRYMSYDHTSAQTTPLRNWIFPPTFYSSGDKERTLSRFFLSGMPNNATTGTLRQHAMRLNSSVGCSKIAKTDFPVPCPGEEPFTATYEMANDISVRICVPGKLGVFPWTLSRNRQDIVEALYLDMWDTHKYRALDLDGDDTDSTVRCEVKTTRGYFELGNLRNNATYGPLLEKWPDADVMARDFNDLVSADYGKTAFVPTESDDFAGNPRVWETWAESMNFPSARWKSSGPLALSAVALFGNISWISDVSRYATKPTKTAAESDSPSWYRMCAGMPFITLDERYGNRWTFYAAQNCQTELENQIYVGATTQNSSTALTQLRYKWIKQFAPAAGDMERLSALLQIGLFVTNQALLNHYAPTVVGGSDFKGRKVYTSPGIPVLKPTMTTGAMIAVSLLIGLQLLGLGCLTWYIYHVPSWTGALDAMAVAHIGARLGKQDILLDGVSGDRERDARALHQVDGLIGVVHVEEGQDDSDTELQQLRRASLEQHDQH